MKATILSLVIAGILIGGAFALARKEPKTEDTVSANNVSIVGGKQIIEVTARGGYIPRKSVAKAGIPTVLQFTTNATFDCSSSVRIQSLGISKNLPSSGTTEIALGSPKPGTLQGTCGMGMYPFEIDFQS